MTSYPPIKLSRLRDIGWKEWDPVRLLAEGEARDRKPFADEYDNYLLRLAGMLRRNATIEEAVAYLVRIERDHMELGSGPGQVERAETTARAIHRYRSDLDGRSPSNF